MKLNISAVVVWAFLALLFHLIGLGWAWGLLVGLGISLIDSVKTYTQLVFQAKEMGTSQQEMKDVWVGLGETSKVFGMDQQALAGSFKAIIQMYS